MTIYKVIDGHTLAYLNPDGTCNVLADSVEKGANMSFQSIAPRPVPMDSGRIRDATEKDFEDFRVKIPPDFMGLE